MDALRLVVVPTVVIAVMVSPGAGAASADPPPTQVITTIAVGSKGQAINGYREADAKLRGQLAVLLEMDEGWLFSPFDGDAGATNRDNRSNQNNSDQ